MGAVYKVHDREIGGPIALKLIRPDLASRPEVLQRFKQELILARQVSHKNVIRIHDLGEADGVRFITMDFVEGRDLAFLIHERGKVPTEEAVRIIAQVCRALEAAHAEGVVHRDLKPQNIMLDFQNRVKVMDFGIARSVEASGGLTQTGAMIGTPEYMSPEQARGEQVDARSDLFSLGIIFYELLTGKTPFHADTVMATIFRRTREHARPPVELDPSIPSQINEVVMKCLAREREERFQTAAEILAALGEPGSTGLITGSGVTPPVAAPPTPFSAPATGAVSVQPEFAPAGFRAVRKKWIIAGAAVLVLLLAALVFRDRWFPNRANPPAQEHALSLAVLPFHNASGDPSIDWLGSSMAEMLRTDIGQSASFRTVSPDRLHDILSALGIGPDATLDSNMLHRVAEFTGADMLLWGQYVKIGGQIRIDARLDDLARQRSLPLKVEAQSDNALLGAVHQLAKSVQQDLTLAPSSIRQMQASAFTPTSHSVAALKNFTQAQQFARQGNQLEALKQFQAALDADPNFALAYSRLGQTYLQLGYDKEAQQNSSKAVELSSSLPATEKYLIEAADSQIENNYDGALQAYTHLVDLLPGDSQIQYSLGLLYENHGDFSKALEHYTRVIASDPKDFEALFAVGRVRVKSGNPQAALDPFNRALSLAVELNNPQGKAKVLQGIGIAYQYLGRPEDALTNFQQSLEIKRRIGDKHGVAVSLDQIAQVDEMLGKPDDASGNYQQEMKIEQEIGDQSGIARVLTNYGDFLQKIGRTDQALEMTKKAANIYLTLSDQSNHAMALNNIGNIYFRQARYSDALTNFQQALALREKLNDPSDVALLRNNIGQSYQEIGLYDQALSSYLAALDTARKASDRLWMAATAANLGGLFEIQGRYGAALNNAQSAFRDLQQIGQKDNAMVAVEADYGLALALVGHSDQAAKPLADALALARSLRDDWLISLALNDQGLSAFLASDFAAAASLFSQARTAADRSGVREQSLIARTGAARVLIHTGRASAAVASLRQLSREADSLGAKYLSAQCALYLGEALVASRNFAAAQAPIQQALRAGRDGGMQSLLPQAEFLQGEMLRAAGHPAEAQVQFQQAGKLLDQMRQESKSDALLRRADLKPIAEAAGIKK